MTDALTRRLFFATTAAVSVTAVTPRIDASDSDDRDVDADFPRTDAERTQAVVRFCHFDLDRVRTLVTEDRSLARAAWDWGFGDWETALGAASHVGRIDIIEFLVAHGARPDHFTLAAVNDVDGVRAVCRAFPGVQRLGGPHGITLLDHARHGKADRVIDFLQDLGDADHGPVRLAMTEADIEGPLGRYTFERDGGVPLIVQRSSAGDGIGVLREGGTFRHLHRFEDHAYTPSGAPGVVIRFGFEAGRAVGLTVHRGRPVLSATRMAD